MLVLYECTGIKTGHLLTSFAGKRTEQFPNEIRSLCPDWDSVAHCPRGWSQKLSWRGGAKTEKKRKERGLERSKKWQFLSQRKIITPTESICIGHCGYNKVVGIQYLFE